MTNVPASAREFERWFDEKKSEWPDELQRLGQIALNAIKMLVGQMLPPKVLAENLSMITDFAESYGAWKAIH